MMIESRAFAVPPPGRGESAHADRFLDLSDAFALPGADDERQRHVLLLADNSHRANVVQDHIRAFQRSRHAIRVLNPIHEPIPLDVAWHELDAILVHYSIFVLGDYFLPTRYAEFLRRFPGPKLQIIQDEYRHVNRMKARQAELGFSAVFSSLSRDTLRRVYFGDTVGGIRYFSCLPGYVPDSFQKLSGPPIAKRPFDIVYRGRDLPFWLGRAGQEKRKIGEQAQRMADDYGLKVDLNWTEESRIYGNAWLRFLMSGRTTLGVEGGSSIFDFDDRVEHAVKRYLAAHQHPTFEEVFREVLAPFEGNVVHRTMTPKLLEAIATDTALILYPGEYRGVLDAYRHYIPLEPDGSNTAEVVAQLRDPQHLQDLVGRTKREVLGRRELSASFYVEAVDAVISHLCATTHLETRDKANWAVELLEALPPSPHPEPAERQFVALPPGFAPRRKSGQVLLSAARDAWVRLPPGLRNLVRPLIRAFRTLALRRG
jgi:hypothetical protein